MQGINPQQLRALQQYLQAQEAQSDGLLTFKAGRMDFDEVTRMVTAQAKPGKVKLVRSAEGLLHFEWSNRISNTKELDLTLFPHDAKWEKISECKDGRVYLLRVLQTNRKYFFWMQEPKDETDEEYFEKVNKLFRGESLDGDAPAANASAANAPAAAANPQLAALQQMGLGGFAPPRTAAANGSAAAATAPATGGGGGQAQSFEQQFQAALAASIQNMMGGSGATGGATGGGANAVQEALRAQAEKMREELEKEPDLPDMLDTSDNPEIKQVLDDEKVCERLAEHLPDDMRSRDDLIQQIESPQFRSALVRLQSVINGPQMSLLLQQMNIPSGDAMGVRAFMQAVSNNAAANAPEEPKPKDDAEAEDKPDSSSNDKDGDADMSG